MSTALQLMTMVSRLSEDQQRDVLSYAEKLAGGHKTRPVDPHGICADLRCDLSFDEFQKNRQEMWGSATEKEI